MVGNCSASPYTEADDAAITLVDAVPRGRFQHIEGAVHEDLKREPWLLGALCDADRGLVEDNVAALGDVVDKVDVANVPDDQLQAWIGEGFPQVGPSPAYQIVEHSDLSRTSGQQLVDDRGADRAGTASDEHRRACERMVVIEPAPAPWAASAEPTDLWPDWR